MLIGTELVAVTHLILAIVHFIYSRRNVASHAQAWIMLLISFIFIVALAIVAWYDEVHPLGILHPSLLCGMLVVSFLLSIIPLGIVMPGYLQAERMIRYALPAAGILLFYLLGLVAGSEVVVISTFKDLTDNFLSGDVLLRIATLALSMYYIINIIVLPHSLIKKESYSLPNHVVTYASLLGIVQLLFIFSTIWFSYPLVVAYEVLFTAVSLMQNGSMLKAHAETLPFPTIHHVENPPTPQEINAVELEDFNEANVRRFSVIEYAMQNGKPYLSAEFNRDNLCKACGYNRHLVLQTLRSQGYVDVHDYITRYRVAELHHLIESGELTDLRNVEMVGFRTQKTAILAFERYNYGSLTEFLQRHQTAHETSEETV